jgi:hypothetical protein
MDMAQSMLAIELKNKQLIEKCSKAEKAIAENHSRFQETGRKIESLINKLYPGVINADDSSPRKLSELVDFLLRRHEAQFHDLGNLHQSLQDQENLYRNEKVRIEREYGEKFRDQETLHASEKASLTTGFDRRLCEDQIYHDEVVTDYKRQLNDWQIHHNDVVADYQRQLDDQKHRLETDYEKQLHEQKVKLENDKAVLSKGLLATVDRFQPITDHMLGSRFMQLKGSVRTLARSPLDDAEGLGEAFDQRAFAQIAPRRHHKFILESTFWSILVDGIFSTPFRVFGSYGEHFAHTWSQLFQKRKLDPIRLAID